MDRNNIRQEPFQPILDPSQVQVPEVNPTTVTNGIAQTELPDGSATFDFAPRKEATSTGGFYENLAEKIDEIELGNIASDLIRGIDDDHNSRQEWLQTRANGLKLLGLKLEQPRGDIGGSSAPLDGMSTVRHPLLLEAVLRFQANARGELLPSGGPIKVRNDGQPNIQKDQIAEALERDMNHYLTVTASEYYADTDQMLFYVGFGGCGFKKVYPCPIRRRPVSESVNADDLIVSNTATDLKNAKRITHVVKMRESMLKRMQIAGAYRTVDLGQPDTNPPNNPVTDVKANIEGIQKQTQQAKDADYTIYECYCELDIKGYEHKDGGKVTGLALPYKVSVDKVSRKILEIRRNWKEKDDQYLAKQVFVKYPYVRAIGFYDIGLVHILGNTAAALTAALRELLDAGMFANFPGFLYSETVGRQLTNEMRVAPGTGQKVQTGGQPIGNVVMPLPYKDPSASFMALVDNISQMGSRIGGTAEIMVGEGKQDAPVGTTLAMIEQATKLENAVHKSLHAAQTEEFLLLKELLKDDPSPLLGPKSKMRTAGLTEAQVIAALNNSDLIPASDPNTPSRLHRIAAVWTLKALQQQNPALYNARAVDEYALRIVGVPDPNQLFNQQPQQAPPDPRLVAIKSKADAQNNLAQIQLLEAKIKAATAASSAQDKAADRASREKIAAMRLELEKLRLAQETMIHTGVLPKAPEAVQ